MGLPNVGKSTLFNALTGTATAQAANYPFCTIDPNSGEVAVTDPRLEEIAAIASSEKIAHARTTFVDIAGLVGGASKGQGLGNRFLASIREVDAIAHLVRCFNDRDIVHVAGQVNPLDDIATIETELMLADLESAERQREKLTRRLKANDIEAKELNRLLLSAIEVLEEGKPANLAKAADQSSTLWRRLGMLTAKPVLYICNVDEHSAAEGNEYSRTVATFAEETGNPCVICSAAFEEQLIGLERSEAQEFLMSVGCTTSGLSQVISVAYELLGLHTFFTAGPKETHAWTIPRGATAVEAADRIHRDFSRGFIRAETVSFADFVKFGGEAASRDAGRLRSEGRDYVVQDGDILRILFNI